MAKFLRRDAHGDETHFSNKENVDSSSAAIVIQSRKFLIISLLLFQIINYIQREADLIYIILI